jgi:hypothetical protein
MSLGDCLGASGLFLLNRAAHMSLYNLALFLLLLSVLIDVVSLVIRTEHGFQKHAETSQNDGKKDSQYPIGCRPGPVNYVL